MTKRLAIIPARGGSKRIPLKNIKLFNGKPIIVYSIEAALSSGLFSEVMVSTDDKQIAEIALAHQASVPFFRSPENSNDLAGTAEVLCEVLSYYQIKKNEFSEACCIYPTAPFVTASILTETHSILATGSYDTVFPIMKFSYPVQRSLKKNNSGRVEMAWPENYSKRSQDLPPFFHDAGQFYWFKVSYMLNEKKLFSQNSYGHEIDELHGQDIDSLSDWKLAELKFNIISGA
ncbi:MAG: pseudaminic acid cytidylyltransferase [bacterium]|jgi:pseudaminic acid cytidylyltransferase